MGEGIPEPIFRTVLAPRSFGELVQKEMHGMGEGQRCLFWPQGLEGPFLVLVWTLHSWEWAHGKLEPEEGTFAVCVCVCVLGRGHQFPLLPPAGRGLSSSISTSKNSTIAPLKSQQPIM